MNHLQTNVQQQCRDEEDQMTDNLKVAVQLLEVLFDPFDTVLLRPIETWTENGKKKSRVDYKHTYHNPLAASIGPLKTLFKLSEIEHINLFFGICPRMGGRGQFDLAWQIRTVRALWTDVDHVSPAKAQNQVEAAGLPPASIVVNSGNGAHIYWLLETPFAIDDAGPPIPVLTEWSNSQSGKRVSRKYIEDGAERIFNYQQRSECRLSPKASHVQDVLTGIAKAVGGDHTTDLARLLRLPGAMNRKNQRNGATPTPTALVKCDPCLRYSFADFERVAQPSPASLRESRIATMPLPSIRRPTASKEDKLAARVAASTIAPQGQRSETDFALCCFAVENGIDKEFVWGKVESVGKFVEGGRRYFDRTWENAEYKCRSVALDKLSANFGSALTSTPNEGRMPQTEADSVQVKSLETDDEPIPELDEPRSRPTIEVEPEVTPVNVTLRQVTDVLVQSGHCFSRAGQLVVIHDGQIQSILSANELAGLLSEHVEFFLKDTRASGYRPIPTSYASTWLNNYEQRRQLSEIKLFTRNPVFTEDWRLVGPGFDQQSGVYYAGPDVGRRYGMSFLDQLLQGFCFKTDGDCTNYLGILLTALHIPRFIGAKPAVLFNGNQPGLGKSMLSQIIAILRDGATAETASYNPNDEEFEKRLGAIVRRGATTIIIDNAKTRGRRTRIDSPCLERSITDAVLSYRLLGTSDVIRAENSHIFCITANSPDLSPDLVSRSVIINLQYEGDPKRRRFELEDPEGFAEQHRVELLGELIGMTQVWIDAGRPLAAVNTRFNKRGWGSTIGGILAANRRHGFLDNADEAASDLDETRREFVELVAMLIDHQQGNWVAAELVTQCQKDGLLSNDLGNGTPKSLATKMGVIAGRFVNEEFTLPDGRVVAFRRDEGRKGKLYSVALIKNPSNAAHDDDEPQYSSQYEESASEFF